MVHGLTRAPLRTGGRYWRVAVVAGAGCEVGYTVGVVVCSVTKSFDV